jgi:hypothetical protein
MPRRADDNGHFGPIAAQRAEFGQSAHTQVKWQFGKLLLAFSSNDYIKSIPTFTSK